MHYVEKYVRNMFSERKKKKLSSLILVEDWGTKTFIKLFSCWHFYISEVGMVVKLMSKETWHIQDKWISSNVVVITRICENYAKALISLWHYTVCLKNAKEVQIESMAYETQCHSVTMHNCRTPRTK